MANETKAKSKVDDTKVEKVEIRMDEKITLTSIAPWDTHIRCIRAVCRGVRKTYKGYNFEYI